MGQPKEEQPAEVPREREVDRHASWAELFFDLVVVAGVGTLAHVLAAGITPTSLGLYAVLFLSFWLTWTTFMLYGNVAAERVNIPRLLFGMFGLAVMAASAPGAAHALTASEAGHGETPTAVSAYTLAYVLTRWFGSQSWRRGEVLLDFPVAQHLAGTLPWLASLWVHDLHMKVWLWAAGVAIDLVLMFAVSGNEMLERYEERAREDDARALRGSRRGGRGGSADPERAAKRQARRFSARGVSVDREHLSERLGLFMIIVLGESMIQGVAAASESEDGSALFRSGVASFVLVAGMFALSLVYGHAGLPHLRADRLRPRALLGLHCLVTGVIATVAVALAAVIKHGETPLPDSLRWLLCGAVAAYFALGLVAAIAAHGFHALTVVAWVVSGIGVPLALATWAGSLPGATLVAYMAAVVMVHVLVERRVSR